jgi:hypothetical protein
MAIYNIEKHITRKLDIIGNQRDLIKNNTNYFIAATNAAEKNAATTQQTERKQCNINNDHTDESTNANSEPNQQVKIKPNTTDKSTDDNSSTKLFKNLNENKTESSKTRGGFIGKLMDLVNLFRRVINKEKYNDYMDRRKSQISKQYAKEINEWIRLGYKEPKTKIRIKDANSIELTYKDVKNGFVQLLTDQFNMLTKKKNLNINEQEELLFIAQIIINTLKDENTKSAFEQNEIHVAVILNNQKSTSDDVKFNDAIYVLKNKTNFNEYILIIASKIIIAQLDNPANNQESAKFILNDTPEPSSSVVLFSPCNKVAAICALDDHNRTDSETLINKVLQSKDIISAINTNLPNGLSTKNKNFFNTILNTILNTQLPDANLKTKLIEMLNNLNITGYETNSLEETMLLILLGIPSEAEEELIKNVQDYNKSIKIIYNEFKPLDYEQSTEPNQQMESIVNKPNQQMECWVNDAISRNHFNISNSSENSNDIPNNDEINMVIERFKEGVIANVISNLHWSSGLEEIGFITPLVLSRLNSFIGNKPYNVNTALNDTSVDNPLIDEKFEKLANKVVRFFLQYEIKYNVDTKQFTATKHADNKIIIPNWMPRANPQLQLNALINYRNTMAKKKIDSIKTFKSLTDEDKNTLQSIISCGDITNEIKTQAAEIIFAHSDIFQEDIIKNALSIVAIKFKNNIIKLKKECENYSIIRALTDIKNSNLTLGEIKILGKLMLIRNKTFAKINQISIDKVTKLSKLDPNHQDYYNSSKEILTTIQKLEFFSHEYQKQIKELNKMVIDYYRPTSVTFNHSNNSDVNSLDLTPEQIYKIFGESKERYLQFIGYNDKGDFCYIHPLIGSLIDVFLEFKENELYLSIDLLYTHIANANTQYQHLLKYTNFDFTQYKGFLNKQFPINGDSNKQIFTNNTKDFK